MVATGKSTGHGGLSTGGAGGVNRAPQNLGGGSGKRAQLTGSLISGYELFFFLSIKNDQIFFHQIHDK